MLLFRARLEGQPSAEWGSATEARARTELAGAAWLGQPVAQDVAFAMAEAPVGVEGALGPDASDPPAPPSAISLAGSTALPAVAQTPSMTPTPTITPTPSVTPTPSQTPPPTDTPTPGPEAGLPIVPPIDAAMKDRLRAIHLDGLARGNRPDVFAKIGDSITASRFFLVDVGCGGSRFDATREQAALAGIVERFRAVPVGPGGSDGPCGPHNSFTRRGFAAASGWTAGQVLAPLGGEITICPPPFDTPLRCELETIKPSIALIMFGTNDLQQRIAPARFREMISRIAAESIQAGVIPVFGTIPPRADAAWSAGLVGAYNGAIVDAAGEAGVPLWNSWRAMAEPAAAGRSLAPDGIHPSVAGRPADFRGEAVLGGYNGRNLGALQVLARISRVVLDDGPPEG